uniref:ATP synthase subunit a n=1 Tax=Cephalonomia gallicola TaxID=627714 RepID=E0WCE6_9HYME|nr:ATP synthase F0 subunit 6 [Cephalonomia gallicola]
MTMNLFTIFDPSTSLKLSFNWISLLMPMILIPKMYWLTPSKIQSIFNLINMKMFNEYKNLSNKYFTNIFMFNKLMMFILLLNFMSLMPYIFNSTSHMSVTMSMSLPIWMTLMLYGWIKKFNMMLYHMVPKNTPTLLMPLMVLIETISNLIRPLTLSIRMSANMIAGHLLMSLISNQFYNNMNLFMMILLIQTLLMILEMSVNCIQAYVFSTLSILYSNEI